MKQKQQNLRWGYSTGACAAAAATAAWARLNRGETPASVHLRFPDGEKRELPLRTDTGHMAAIRKDGGDDPDCTHGATLYADIRPCRPDAVRPEDYALKVGDGTVILRAVEGVGLCTRRGLDCEPGRWAVNRGPRRMIVDNLSLAGLKTGCWLLEIGVENGESLAKRTLNAHLGITGGLSILGTTGLVRPYSHEAYIHTIRVCVRSHHLAGGSSVVFCTGGRTKAGAEARLPELPATAFISIGDFIAESLATACRYGMREIIVACMPGKLCKYAAGFANTHAHKVGQDMNLLRAEISGMLPDETALLRALEHSASVREALLSIPDPAGQILLRRLARTALSRFARRCSKAPALRLLAFDFEGGFLFEEAREAEAVGGDAPGSFGIFPERVEVTDAPGTDDEETDPALADPGEAVGPLYFMRRPAP